MNGQTQTMMVLETTQISDDNNDGFEDDKVFTSGVLTPGSGGLRRYLENYKHRAIP